MNRTSLAALAVVTFALGFGELMVAGIVPAIARDTAVTIPAAGQLVTVYALTFAVLSPPLALLLRATAVKTVLIAGVSVVALANASAALATNFALLVIARVVAAAGSAVATPLALAAVDRVSEERFRGRAHGIVYTGFSLAAMLGVPLGTLIAERFGWRATFGTVAALCCGAALLCVRWVPSGDAVTALRWGDLRTFIGQPQLRPTLAVSALFLTAQYTVFTYFRPYFERTPGTGVDTIVALFFLYGVCGIGGTLLGGSLVDRIGTRTTLLVTIGGCGCVFAALPFSTQTVFGASVAVSIWALTSWAFAPAVNRQLTAIPGDTGDVALALNLTAFNLGIALGSALGGAMIALRGIAALPLGAAFLIALAWLIALRTR